MAGCCRGCRGREAAHGDWIHGWQVAWQGTCRLLQTSDTQKVCGSVPPPAAAVQWDARIYPPLLAPRTAPGLAALSGCLWEIPRGRGRWHPRARGSAGPLMDRCLHLGTPSSPLRNGGVCVAVQPLPRRPAGRRLLFLSDNVT